MLKSVHRAKYALAEPDILLANAAVHISDPGRISRVEPWHDPPAVPGIEVIDWGSAVIIPGLINAHAHLELTALHGQLTAFTSFTDWISQLIDRRQQWTREHFLNSTLRGARQALSSGTTMVGDVTSSGYGWEIACGAGLRRVVFQEAISLSPDDADQALAKVQSILDSAPSDPLLLPGISPHAPYSVSPELYRRMAEMARNRQFLLATHVAETRAEIQFLESGTGEFVDFLNARGVLPSQWEPPGMKPIPYLDSLGVMGQSCVLIHCNYLDESSIRRILSTRSSVVYCPRSHDFFGHDAHPVRQLLDSGVHVALGTDSLASNRSLSILDEMRHLFKVRKDLKPEEILRAATLNGAAALGFGGVLGRMRRGYWADLAVLEIPENLGPRQLLTQILEGAGECIATIVQGRVAWMKKPLAVDGGQ
jgi:cytosine/adenosine deaminase-related metal-dependent hydrolase